jgi:hypothetical protein
MAAAFNTAETNPVLYPQSAVAAKATIIIQSRTFISSNIQGQWPSFCNQLQDGIVEALRKY